MAQSTIKTNYLSHSRVDCTPVSGSPYASGSVYIHKVGAVCFLKITNLCFNTFTGRQKIATIPAGYAPLVEAYGLITYAESNSSNAIIINTDGIFVDSALSGKQHLYDTSIYLAQV